MTANASRETPATFADSYEETLVPVIFRPWARELIRRVAPQDGERVLDLACGTGAVTQEVIASRVSLAGLTGVDISGEMLAVARRKADKAGFDTDWIEADAAHLPLPDGRFDVAFCQQALQFFPDRPAALMELRRVMAAGARAAFCVSTELSQNPLLRAQAATLEKYLDADAGAAVGAICNLSDAGEIRALFEGAGFTNVEVDHVSLTLRHPDGRGFAAGAMGGMHTGDWLGRLPEAERRECIDHFLTGLGAYFDGTALQFPHVSKVITARA